MIRLWDIESKAEIQLVGHGGSVTALEFTPDGKHLISEGTDNSIRIGDVESRTEIDILHGRAK